MRAVICKEVWENLPWAALALLAGALMWWWALGSTPWPNPLLDGREQGLVHFFAAAVAALLGAVQGFHEAHGARRALLLHRPLSRSKIFWSKAFAGLGLYLLAVGIPFAGAVLWVATPGHVAAPFRAALALPGVADILAGMVYWFAALLTVQREARWYGSRGLGLVTALLCSMLVLGVPAFWQALLVIALGILLLATATWGSFLTGGAYAPQPRRARAALGATLLLGLLIVGLFVVSLCHNALGTRVEVTHKLARNGQALIVRYENFQVRGVTDLEGNVPPEFQGKPLDYYKMLAKAVFLFTTPYVDHHYRRHRDVFLPFGTDRGYRVENWFYDFEQARLLGYQRDTRTFIGSIGPDGFTPAGEKPGPGFKGKLCQRYGDFNYLTFDDIVYTVNLGQRTLRTLFTPALGEYIVDAQPSHMEKQTPLAFIATDRAVYAVAEEDGRRLLSAPAAPELAQYRLVVADRLSDPPGYVLWFRQRLDRDAGPNVLITYDAAGQEVARRAVPPLPPVEPVLAHALYGLVTPPLPAAVVAAIMYLVGATLPPGVPLALLVPFVALMLVSALACGAACLVLARRYAFTRAACIGWTLLGLLFGLVGLLLMVALQEWPARVVCPGCRRLRVVTRATCEHCGVPHAAPARDGTEIFEPALEDLTADARG